MIMVVKYINMRIVWGIFMIAIYLSMSFLLVFTDLFNRNMVFTMRLTFGVLFLCYSIFRGYRLFKYKK